MRVLTALFFIVSWQAMAQRPEVPHKMQFAGMTLSIRDDARREIQKDVDALTQSPKHFNIKVERAKTYFPIIEKIFAEENVPDDFKYLAIQESALIPDAVSVSNAVGFWQFKEFTALEVGLRVDKEIDERLNIASASRGAARYFKKNNFYFNNWLYALQAYQMGAGGVLQSVKDSQSGATHMEVTSKTYWYVKKYLAHKIAFEGAVSGKGQVALLTYDNKSKRTLSELSKEFSVDEAELQNYNKWAKRGSIPDDRSYVVVVPVTGDAPTVLTDATASTASLLRVSKGKVPVLPAGIAKINGIATIVALAGDTPTKLATRAGVDLSDFLRWNDMSISDTTPAGSYYLLGKKRARATEAYYRVRDGENLWSVSQRYGVQIKKLRKYNRLKNGDDVAPGTTLWLASMKPKEGAASASKHVVEVDNQDSFAWNADSPPVASSSSAVITSPATSTPAVTIVTPEGSEEKQNDAATSVGSVLVSNDTARTPEPVKENIVVVSPPQPVVVDSVKTIVVTPPVEKKDVHVVQAGERLYSLAKQYNVTVMDLVRWNNLDLQQSIKPGQVLKLTAPPDETPADEMIASAPKTVIHEVVGSDTLYSIARKYGVTIKELMDWNQKKDFALSTGEKLKVIQK